MFRLQPSCLFSVNFTLQGIQLGTETVFGSFYSIGFYGSDRGIKHHCSLHFHLQLMPAFSHLLLISCHVL